MHSRQRKPEVHFFPPIKMAGFWRPGASFPGSVEREVEKEGGAPLYAPNTAMSIKAQRLRLPITQYRTQFLYLVETSSVVIIVGHTGCGKTTQVPQFLHEAGWTEGKRCVACTQPRRVAATTIAGRVAEEMGGTLGREVGYAVRFDECWDSETTRIKYMTDGMLVRECMLDPLLSRYSVVMVDEAHERSVHTDILLGLLKKIQKRRKDLRIVISSATLDAADFRRFFSDSPSEADRRSASIISVEGQLFPVDITYTVDPVPDYVKATVELVSHIHKTRPHGDILCFLTGQEEIEETCKMVREINDGSMLILPLYAGLQRSEQMKVFDSTPDGSRKVVIATNIAESSVTIDGVVYVIDCGFVKQRFHNPLTGVEMLPILPCSKASLSQRSGRAGRVKPGIAFRLMTQKCFESLKNASIPDIQRVNLAPVLLQLKSLGIDDVLHFDYMSPPPPESMQRALELLYSLGAIDDACKLTANIGHKMAEFPVDPMIARMILASDEGGCGDEIITIAAMLAVEQVFVSSSGQKIAGDRARRRFAVHEGDHLTYLNVFKSHDRILQTKGQNKAREWANKCGLNVRGIARAREIRNQLKRYCKRFRLKLESCGRDTVALRRTICHGFFSHAAVLDGDGTYTTIRDKQKLWIHPNSSVFRYPPPVIIYHEVMLTDKPYARDVTAVEPDWLAEIAPHFYQKAGNVEIRVEPEPPKKIFRTDSVF